MKEDIDEILANYLNKESLTDEEKRALEAWRNTSTRNEIVGRVIQKLEQQKKTLDKHQKQDIAFTKVERRVYQARRKQRRILWSSCAAGIALIAGFLFILKWEYTPKQETLNQTYIPGLALTKPSAELILPNGKKRLLDSNKTTIIVSDSTKEIRTDDKTLIVETDETQTREPEYYTMNVPLGAEYNIILQDGTKIYLNAGTSLRYPDQFAVDKREVFLDGEAYFEVTSDSLRPFIVHAAEVSVRVLGTSFNINAYPDGAWVRTTLVQGRVETQCGDKNFIMKPGTQVAYNKETHEAEYLPVNTQQFISWKEGYYDFEDMPLGELMQIFSRWYNIKIEFTDPELKTLKFSGRLKRYDDLKPLFDMLEYTRDVIFIMGNDRIIIQKK